MTHKAFKLTTNNWSRDGTTYWYRCSAKKATGCTATATIKRVAEGNIVVKNYLLEVSTPEVVYHTNLPSTLYKLYCFQVHAIYHAPEQATMIVDDLILQMKKYIDENPMLPVGEKILNIFLNVFIALS